jgi:hypothetical protein
MTNVSQSGSANTARPPGTQHAARLGKYRQRVGHVLEDSVGVRAVDTVVSEGKAVDIAAVDLDLRERAGALPRLLDHARGVVDADHRAVVTGRVGVCREVRAGSTTQIEDHVVATDLEFGERERLVPAAQV